MRIDRIGPAEQALAMLIHRHLLVVLWAVTPQHHLEPCAAVRADLRLGLNGLGAL
jgi:hypothetical protein